MFIVINTNAQKTSFLIQKNIFSNKIVLGQGGFFFPFFYKRITLYKNQTL